MYSAEEVDLLHVQLCSASLKKDTISLLYNHIKYILINTSELKWLT